MERGEHVKKKKGIRAGMKRFFERSFDWIALFIITLIILLTLVFF